MKTLADLKRTLKPGTFLTMVRHDWYPSGRLIGMRREIVHANSVGIGLATTRDSETVVSRMDWPNRAGLVIDGPRTFSVTLDDTGALMTYSIG